MSARAETDSIDLQRAVLEAMMRDHIEDMKRDISRGAWWGDPKPLPPRPWHRRLRNRIRARVNAGRERVALFVCPWLERD